MRKNKVQPAHKSYFFGKVIKISEQPLRLLGLKMHRLQKPITTSTAKKD